MENREDKRVQRENVKPWKKYEDGEMESEEQEGGCKTKMAGDKEGNVARMKE